MKNILYNCGFIGIEIRTISHTFAVILAATAQHPRWRRKPSNGLLTMKNIHVDLTFAGFINICLVIRISVKNKLHNFENRVVNHLLQIQMLSIELKNSEVTVYRLKLI